MKITSIDVMELKPRRTNNGGPSSAGLIPTRASTDTERPPLAYGVGASAAFGMIKDLAGTS